MIALWLRSGAKTGEAALSADEEMDYAVTLNRALPDDIRVLGWTPVPETFSARYNSCSRPGPLNCSNSCLTAYFIEFLALNHANAQKQPLKCCPKSEGVEAKLQVPRSMRCVSTMQRGAVHERILCWPGSARCTGSTNTSLCSEGS